MPPFRVFALDDWVRTHRAQCKIDLSSSCVEPLTLAQLQAFDPSRPVLADGTALNYGPNRGLLDLRTKICALYNGMDEADRIGPEDIVVTSGAIAANYLVLRTIVSPGDHVVVQHSTYGQLIEIPKRVGADVSLWRWKHRANDSYWTLNLDELEALIQPNTKLIVLTNPSNPTGAVTSREGLERVVKLAKARGIVVMCDEVFRDLHHDQNSTRPPSLLELGYENSIITSSVSKSYALPGVRCGWVAASPSLRKTVLQRVAETRDYTTITVSQIDQQVASFALTPGIREAILARSEVICRKNLGVLKAWAQENEDWAVYIEPAGSGICMIGVLDANGSPVDDGLFAEALAQEEGVCAPPAGKCFGHEVDGEGETDLKGFLRIGIVTADDSVERGLHAIGRLRSRWIGVGR